MWYWKTGLVKLPLVWKPWPKIVSSEPQPDSASYIFICCEGEMFEIGQQKVFGSIESKNQLHGTQIHRKKRVVVKTQQD